MRAWRTVLAGMLALGLLDAAVSSKAAGSRFGGIFTGLATVVEHVLSPTVPAIPDLRKRAPADTTGVQQASGSLLPPSWTTSPTVPASSTPPRFINV